MGKRGFYNLRSNRKATAERCRGCSANRRPSGRPDAFAFESLVRGRAKTIMEWAAVDIGLRARLVARWALHADPPVRSLPCSFHQHHKCPATRRSRGIIRPPSLAGRALMPEPCRGRLSGRITMFLPMSWLDTGRCDILEKHRREGAERRMPLRSAARCSAWMRRPLKRVVFAFNFILGQ